MSAFESLYGGQFTLSTRLMKPNYLTVTFVQFCWHSPVGNNMNTDVWATHLYEQVQKSSPGAEKTVLYLDCTIQEVNQRKHLQHSNKIKLDINDID